MTVPVPFLRNDIAPFIALAEAEGWITGEWELQFLLDTFSQGCFVKREDEETLGYITSARHDKSGWIGNLLVAPKARRRGIGKDLMNSAIDALLRKGVETVWLTASAKGEELYRKLGFRPIDTINRWVGRGNPARELFTAPPLDRKAVEDVDREGWGDYRKALLEVTSGRGRVYCGTESFLCTQPWETGLQIGPWGALSAASAETLLDFALSGTDDNVFLDVPARNVAAAAMLTRRGFSIRGSNTLMYLGVVPDYEPTRIFSLASMGSMG